MSVRLGIVQINVTDRAQAKEFYLGKLGLRLLDRDPHTGVVGGTDEDGGPLILDSGSGHILLLYPVPDENQKGPGYPNHVGNVCVFYVDDIDATHAAWKTKGVEFLPIQWSEEETGIAGCPFGRFIAFKDPFGNVHELLQPIAP